MGPIRNNRILADVRTHVSALDQSRTKPESKTRKPVQTAPPSHRIADSIMLTDKKISENDDVLGDAGMICMANLLIAKLRVQNSIQPIIHDNRSISKNILLCFRQLFANFIYLIFFCIHWQ